jgi:ferredoxin
MAVVTLTINDEMVSAQEGTMLLAVLREQGIEMPTLCHLDGLSERGGCRLCMVELGSGRLQASCVTPVQEGMVVNTHSERLVKYRQMILELLFAERNHICAVCVMNGHCELQWEAAKIGMDHVRFDYLQPGSGHGRQPRALRAGPQPLHPLHALRARLRRDRGRACVGCDGPRGEQPGDRRPQPGVGVEPELYELWQMCAGLPDGRALRQRRHCGRDGEAAQFPAVDLGWAGEKCVVV